MKSKTLSINNTDVVCSHEINQQQNGHTTIHLTVDAGNGATKHVMTIGAVDQPLDAKYGQQELQRDFDAFRSRCAAMAESHARGKKLADQVE
jgi:hypothetical protein